MYYEIIINNFYNYKNLNHCCPRKKKLTIIKY